MNWENPFLTRELRQHRGERLRMCLARLSWICSLGLLPLLMVVVPALAWRAYGLEWTYTPPPPFLLVMPHGMLCFLAAGYGLDRFVAAERRQATLGSVLLVSLPPSHWLLQKLVFPLYVLVLTWLAGLPFYLAAAALDIDLPLRLLTYSLIPLALGLYTLTLPLLVPSETLLEGAEYERPRPWEHLLLAPLVLLPFLIAGIWGVFKGMAGRWSTSQLFCMHVPDGVVLALLLPILPVGSYFTGLAALSGGEASARLAHRARLACVTWLYLLLFGLFGFQWWVLLGAALSLLAGSGPLYQELKQRWRRARRPHTAGGASPDRSTPAARKRIEDPRSRGDVAWLAGYWDNPIFVRDLRMRTRAASFRRALIGGWMAFGIILLIIGLLPLTAFVGAIIASPAQAWHSVRAAGAAIAPAHKDMLALFCGAYSLLILVGGASGSPTGRAQLAGATRDAEPRLPEEFATPLASEDLLLGRAVAAALYSWCFATPAIMGLAVSALYAAWRGVWSVFPLLAACLPLLAAVVLPHRYLSPYALAELQVEKEAAPPRYRPAGALRCLLLLVELAVLGALLSGRLPASVPAAFLLSPLLFWFNVTYLRDCWHARVRRLNALRLAQPKPSRREKPR